MIQLNFYFSVLMILADGLEKVQERSKEAIRKVQVRYDSGVWSG